jgi:hypothetical protein
MAKSWLLLADRQEIAENGFEASKPTLARRADYGLPNSSGS